MYSRLLEYFSPANVYTVFLSVFLVICAVRWFFRTKNLPPGPYNLPIVGYMPFLDKSLESSFLKLSEKYGEVFRLKLGQRYLVVLSSWDSIKEAFIDKNHVFSGRPKPFSVAGWIYDYEGVMVCDGDAFKEQKTFILSSLRQLGYGKANVLTFIEEEAEVVTNLLRDKTGIIDDISRIFNTMTTNIICSITFGKRFDHGDEKLNKILEIIHLFALAVEEVILFEAYPILRFLPSSFFGWNKLEKIKGSVHSFVDEIIDEHIDSFDPNSSRDLIDFYLKAMQEKGLNFNEEHNGTIFSRSYLRNNLSLLFPAGTETTANVLTFAIKMLLIHPEIQQKIQEEIDLVIGRSRVPAWIDRDALPYTSATILEIHRYCTAIPTTPFHTNTEEAVLKGFTIPKDTYVTGCLWQIHHDPSLWNDPEKFDPTRFINENGEIVKPDYLIPFSTGRRMCLGDNLANMEIFLFLTSLLQNFTFLPVDSQSKQYDIIHSIVRKLKPFKVKVECR